MELKQLNKITILLFLIIGITAFSQMKMADLEGKKFSINLKTEKRNIIPILNDINYSVYYVVEKKRFDLKLGLGVSGVGNVIFFSKKNNKGILVKFEQMMSHAKKNVYEISLRTGSHGKYMFIPSMIIVDKDFNYEYLMEYRYMHLPYDKDIYTSTITIQNNKNYCSFKHMDLKGNAIYENIDDILSNIPKIEINENKSKECDPLISDEDLNYFFPEKIDKDGHVYYKK